MVEVAFDVNGAPRRIHGRGAVLAALAASGLLGAGLRAAASPGAASPRAVLRAAAPEPPQSSLVPAETAAVGFEELPNLIAIEPGDGALDAELDTVLRLTFDAPIDPESVGYLSVNLEEQGSGAVVGRLSVEGAVVTYAPIRSLVLDHEYSVQVDALMAGSGWIELGAARFRTRDGLWSTPEALVLEGASNPELAIGPGGDALLLWEASTERGERLHGAFFASGAPAWQLFTPTASGGPAARPTQVAAGDDGLFAFTWVDGPALLGALYQVGDGDLLDGYDRLGPARVVSDATDALWAGGRALVATNHAGALLDVYHTEGDRFWPGAKAIARVDDGSRFHGPLLLGDGTTSARALWLQSAGPGGASMPLTVSAATLFYSGDWSEPVELAALDPSAGVRSLTGEGSESGLALLAWESAAGEANRVAVAPAGSRLGLLVLGADGSASASRPDAIDELGSAYRPAVAVSAEGDAVVTWVASSGNDSDVDAATAVWGASLLAGEAAWSAPVPLSDAAASARAPALALASDGAGHAAWVEVDAEGGARLVAARFTAEGGFSAPSELTAASAPAAPAHASSLATDVESGPRIAVDPQGRALAVWISTAGGLWYSRHE